MTSKVGRRGGEADTRGDILRAGREHFARGYSDATVRAIARAAGVDPSLIVQFYGGKDGLFRAVIADAVKPESIQPVVEGGREGIGRRLAAWFFELWEAPERRYPFQALLLSAASHPPAAELLREFVTDEIVARVASVSRRKDARLRAELAGSHLIGTALTRYVYQIPPLSEVPTPELVRRVGGAIDGYLLGPVVRSSRRRRTR